MILYHRSTALTGRRLARLLGLKHGSTPKGLISVRWGSSVSHTPDISPNTQESIRLASNGRKSLLHLRDSGLLVPKVYTTPPDNDYPILGRRINHRAGKDIIWCKTKEEATKANSSYFTGYMSVVSEFRVHVFGGKPLRMFRKVGGENELIRTSTFGWEYRRSDMSKHPKACEVAVNAVGALGLCFGGVDLGWGKDGYVVFEVNTGPALNTISLLYYAQKLEAYLLKQEVGYVSVGLCWTEAIEKAVACYNQR